MKSRGLSPERWKDTKTVTTSIYDIHTNKQYQVSTRMRLISPDMMRVFGVYPGTVRFYILPSYVNITHHPPGGRI